MITHACLPKDRPNLLVLHADRRLILLIDDSSLHQWRTMLNLLFCLHKIAESTATCRGDVDNTVALKVVSATDIRTLHGHGNPVETEAAGGAEHQASSVDGLVALEIGILAETMVCLAEGDAREAIGHEAKIDGVEAAK